MKLSIRIWLCFFLCLPVACAEVTRPTPTGHEVETCQLAATLRHPYKNWSMERVSQTFLRVLATAPQMHGQTYPFLGFDWWVTATQKIIIDNIWHPSPAAQAGLRQGDIILAINNWPLFSTAEEWDRFIKVTGDLLRNVYISIGFQEVLGRDFIYWADKYLYTNLYSYLYPWSTRFYAPWSEERIPLRGNFEIGFSAGEVLVALLMDVKHIAMEARGSYLTGAVELLIQRGDQKFKKILYPQHLPAEYAIFVNTRSNAINAWAEPGQIILSSGLVNLCINDDELAFVIGHELAHQILGHLLIATGQRQLGELIGRVVSGVATFHLNRLLNLETYRIYPSPFFILTARRVTVSVFSPDLEREADTYGLWFAYQAGYDIDKALALFERMTARGHDPFERTYFLASHPAPLERMARLKKVAQYFKVGRAAEVFLQSPDLGRVPIETQ
ncbi:MAG: M48 family metalloprotease [Deltaproteobacteria bacterium]|nr:M48 family metalloprotease [Deltaproteobacteria bacterium]MBW1952598.1 M48 family metalloprotease [Deltaproteobacteria bacterium]MBW1987155.1 M48 family metalloprotease [Deltaproteobacteria bacterium]MBW2133909.1 M48 family metalloprotease [Deltaproteobacteria bacterium]